jgi:hypothetical protein
MRVFGRTTKLMDMVSLWIQMEPCMKESGMMTCNMDMELRHGIKVVLNIQVSFIKVKRMEKADLNGKMVLTMKEIL